MQRKHDELRRYQARLAALDSSTWPLEQRIDYELVRAQMNGLDFDIRVLQPWARDPAFYLSVWTEQSDTPEHEGPAHHALVELWTYEFPLVPDGREETDSRVADDPAVARTGATQLDRQCARPVAHRHRHDAAAGWQPRKAREADVRIRAGIAARDSLSHASHAGIRCVAGATGAGEDGTFRRRQGGLHLEPAKRAPDSVDLGPGSRCCSSGSWPAPMLP